MQLFEVIIRTARISLFFLIFAWSGAAGAGDRTGSTGFNWPQWRGPDRDGRSQETGLIQTFPRQGPEVLWRRQIGTDGYSGIVVVDEYLYTMYSDGDYEYVVCLDVDNGAEEWLFRTDNIFLNQRGRGPRSTPLVDDDRVYVLSSKGRLHCVSAFREKQIWQVDLRSHYGGKTPRWGYSSSPIIVDDLLLVEVGKLGRNAIVAFDKFDGSVMWTSDTDAGSSSDKQANRGRDKQGYSSPVYLKHSGQVEVIFFTGTQALGVSLNGDFNWRYSWNTRFGANAATPVVVPGRRLFISSGYNKGCALLQINSQAEGPAVEKIWQNRRMRCSFSSAVFHDGYLYGFDEKALKCINAETGDEQWRKSRLGFGNLIYADGQLIVLTENGDLRLIEASPDQYVEKSRARIFGRIARKCWTAPSLANGKLYARSLFELVSLDFKDHPSN